MLREKKQVTIQLYMYTAGAHICYQKMMYEQPHAQHKRGLKRYVLR